MSVAGVIGYVPKNNTTQPWVTDMDLSIQQDIPGFADGHRGTIYFTIDNLLNLLDLLLQEDGVKVDREDELIAGCLLTHGGELVHEGTARLLAG